MGQSDHKESSDAFDLRQRRRKAQNSLWMENFNVSDDGLVFPEIGPWAEEKYRLIALYDELFSKGMKDKWDVRVYIDLYAGAGFGKVKGTETRLMGSPLIALAVEYPFDRYIFCEQDPEKMTALQKRVERLAPSADVIFINGN